MKTLADIAFGIAILMAVFHIVSYELDRFPFAKRKI